MKSIRRPASAGRKDRAGNGAARLRDHRARETDPEGDPLRQIAEYVAQLREYTAYYLRARSDRLWLAVRDALWHLELRAGLFGLSVAFVVVAVAYVLDGAAHGLALALGGRMWLASLLTGVAGLLIFGAVVLTGLRRARGAAHRRRMADYEARKQRQEARFGSDGARRSGTRGQTLSATANERGPGRPPGHADAPAAQPAESP